MVRQFAAVLGLVGFATVLLRGALAGAAMEATVSQSLACLVLLALIGAAVAGVGQWILKDVVRERLVAGSKNELNQGKTR